MQHRKALPQIKTAMVTHAYTSNRNHHHLVQAFRQGLSASPQVSSRIIAVKVIELVTTLCLHHCLQANDLPWIAWMWSYANRMAYSRKLYVIVQ